MKNHLIEKLHPNLIGGTPLNIFKIPKNLTQKKLRGFQDLEAKKLTKKVWDTSYVCMTDLGWFQGKQNKPFSNSWRQLTSNAHELKEVTTFIQTYASWTEHEGIVYKVSNTSVMFNVNHGGDKMLLMGSTTTHQNFPYHWTSTVMWTRW